MSDSDSQTTLPFTEDEPVKKTARKVATQRRGRPRKVATTESEAADAKPEPAKEAATSEAPAPEQTVKKAVRRGRVARTPRKAAVEVQDVPAEVVMQAPSKVTAESAPAEVSSPQPAQVIDKEHPAKVAEKAEGREKSQADRMDQAPAQQTPDGERERQHSGNERRQGGGDNRQDRHSSQGGNRFQQNRKGKQRNHPSKGGAFPNRDKKFKKFRKSKSGGFAASIEYGSAEPDVDELLQWEVLQDETQLAQLAEAVDSNAAKIDFDELYQLSLPELEERGQALEIIHRSGPRRKVLLEDILRKGGAAGSAIEVSGILEVHEDGYGFLVYSRDSYQLVELCTLVPQVWIRKYGLQRGHEVKVQAIAPREEETTPVAVKIITVMGKAPEEIISTVPFTELVPYYPTARLLLETSPEARWDNISMRCVDLLTPIGLGQRGLIVAPPRTGKTVLLQAMANAVAQNNPEAHLIVLLIDERPEEVTDFRRNTSGEVISSTFDESAESHVHAAEMVIEKSRRMVEAGRHVVILLDSITRLARAYNTLMPNSGKILSGGVEANALQKPKRFFGSARNIEGGGSLTILGTALIDTGSRMDEVIFEEFKGTGNMELHLDRALVDKRIFPALSFEKSGTRKEELLYHPDEMNKIYSLRRAMKGVPSTEAMELLIQRVKKTKSNVEFLMSLSR